MIVPIIWSVIDVLFWKFLPMTKTWIISPICLSHSCSPILRYLIILAGFSKTWKREKSSFNVLHVNIQFPRHHLLKMISFLQHMFMIPLMSKFIDWFFFNCLFVHAVFILSFIYIGNTFIILHVIEPFLQFRSETCYHDVWSFFLNF